MNDASVKQKLKNAKKEEKSVLKKAEEKQIKMMDEKLDRLFKE